MECTYGSNKRRNHEEDDDNEYHEEEKAVANRIIPYKDDMNAEKN